MIALYTTDIILCHRSRLSRPDDNAPVAMAKSGFVFFNYQSGKVVPMPEAFYRKFEKVNWIG
jgi:acyl-CoA thioesterase FadM